MTLTAATAGTTTRAVERRRPTNHPRSDSGVTRSCRDQPEARSAPSRAPLPDMLAAMAPKAAEDVRNQTPAGRPCTVAWAPRTRCTPTTYSSSGTTLTRNKKRGLRQVRMASKRAYADMSVLLYGLGQGQQDCVEVAAGHS